MKIEQQSFLFFELLSGDILAQLTLEDRGLFPTQELKQKVTLLSKDLGLDEQNIGWVRCYNE